jgi:hypothetical protein
MAFKTRTWDDVLGLTEARSGNAFSSTEKTRVGHLINSAAKYIYEESRYWSRFLVLEPRMVERGYIAFTEDSLNVYGAGAEEVNGLYVLSGEEFNSHSVWKKVDEDYYIRRETHGEHNTWHLVQASSATAPTADKYFYSDGHGGLVPDESGWSVDDDGVSPTPISQATSEIDEYIGHWDGAKWQGSDPMQMSAYLDQNGIRVTQPQDGLVYVAFKKTFTDVLGDGTGGTVADIPAEWAEYISYSAARAYRASQAQPDGYNPIALRDVDNVLGQALIKVGKQGVYNTLANQFKTRYGMDVSIR